MASIKIWRRCPISFISTIFRKSISFSTQTVRIFFYRRLWTATVNGNAILRQPAVLLGQGKISFDGRVIIGYFPSPFFFSTYAHIEARRSTAQIRIGSGTHINNNFSAIAEHSSITIGMNCRIGCNVEILDSDFHGIEPGERSASLAEWARPVVIANNVFIGSNVKVMKGVTIGEGAAIANSSLVSSDVAAYSLVGGNPARFIKALKNE
jgi:acetyltransferase-like isoleucine patch superfamily enzyme